MSLEIIERVHRRSGEQFTRARNDQWDLVSWISEEGTNVIRLHDLCPPMTRCLPSRQECGTVLTFPDRSRISASALGPPYWPVQRNLHQQVAHTASDHPGPPRGKFGGCVK